MAQVALHRAGLQAIHQHQCFDTLGGARQNVQKPLTKLAAGVCRDLSTFSCKANQQQTLSNRDGHFGVYCSQLERERSGDWGIGKRSSAVPYEQCFFAAVPAPKEAAKTTHRGMHVCRAAASEGTSELSELEKVQKLDKLIDKLREASDRELPQIVAQNVMELDQVFWLRMATRADVCKSEDDKEDFMELSQRVMTLVHKIVQKTEEKIDDNAGVLEMVLDAAAEKSGEWLVPLSKERINAMKKVMEQRQEYLDETFLASVFAYSRKVENESMGSMLVVLQRVMQLWASWYMTRHPKGRLNKDKKTPEEAVLERVLKAEVEDWDAILRENLVSPGSKLNEEKFFNTIQSRMERSILYMENGSYSQRVVAEFLREIQARSQSILDAERAPSPEVSIKFDNAES